MGRGAWWAAVHGVAKGPTHEQHAQQWERARREVESEHAVVRHMSSMHSSGRGLAERWSLNMQSGERLLLSGSWGGEG